jgi:hypothetical protein
MFFHKLNVTFQRVWPTQVIVSGNDPHIFPPAQANAFVEIIDKPEIPFIAYIFHPRVMKRFCDLSCIIGGAIVHD